MKRACHILCLLVVLLIGMREARAQSGLGGLRGQVVDADYGFELPGAKVTVPEIGKSATSDDAGFFFINEIPGGSYAVSVTLDGYIAQTGNYAITPGQVNQVRIPLTANVVTLDEFVVVADDFVEEEDVQIISIRQDLVSFADIIGEDFIKQVGGGDAGDVLKKGVGTSVVDDRFVVVRGLSDRYNTIYLNGARVPSSDPDKRAVNIDLFPSSIIGSLTNYKTSTPDLPSEATGGHIDITTKTSVPENFFKSSVEVGYNSLSSGNDRFLSYNGGGTGLFGTRAQRIIPDFLRGQTTATLPFTFRPTAAVRANRIQAANIVDRTTGTNVTTAPFDSSFGFEIGRNFEFFGYPASFIGAFNYSKSYTYDDDFQLATARFDQAAPGDPLVFDSFFEGFRGEESLNTSLLLSAAIEPGAGNKLALNYISSLVAEDLANFYIGQVEGFFGDPRSGIPPSEANEVAVRENIQYTERRLQFLQLAGTHVFGTGDLFGISDRDVTVDWSVSYALSSQYDPDVRTSNYGVRDRNTNNPQFAINSSDLPDGKPFERVWRELDDQNYFVNLDLTVPLFDGSDDEKVTFLTGGRFDSSRRDFRQDVFVYQLGGEGPAPQDLDPDNRLGLTVGDLVADRVSASNGSPNYIYRSDPASVYVAEQNIATFYFMLQQDLSETLQITYGSKLEQFNLSIRPDIDLTALDTASSTFVGINRETGEIIPQSDLGKANLDDTRFFPSVTAKWDFFDDMSLRVAYSRTTARPSIKEVAPVFTRDVDNASIFSGNVGLQPSIIDNYDVRWEWFPGAGDTFAISVFTKLIDEPIERTQSGGSEFFTNEVSATIYGFELEGTKSLDFIGGPFENVSLSSNFTKLFSSVESDANTDLIRRNVGLPLVRPLQGQPDYIFNFNIVYDNEEWGLFASLLLNVTGRLLYATGTAGSEGGAPDIYQEPITTLNLVMSKKLTENLTLTFQANNLTGSGTERRYEGGLLNRLENKGRTYSIGISGEW